MGRPQRTCPACERAWHGAPRGRALCDDCRAFSTSLTELHQWWQRTQGCPADMEGREERIKAHAERVEREGVLEPARHGKPKLTAEQADEVRRLRAEGMKVRVIAERFGVGAATITRATRETTG
jgi:hypothetical protein